MKNNLILYMYKIFVDPIWQTMPGVGNFLHLYRLYGIHVYFVDRTETLKFPVSTKVLTPIPSFRKFEKSYAEIANERAVELLRLVKINKKRIILLYSGGIDSTLILSLLLKHADSEERKNITVLMSEDSIKENENFFRKYIAGELVYDHVKNLNDYINDDIFFISGELNDQLLGIGTVMRGFHIDYYHEAYSRTRILEFLNSKINEPEKNQKILFLLEEIVKKAPIEIKTNFEFFWWINFTLKWQYAELKFFIYLKKHNEEKVNLNFYENNYVSFFNTEEFQLWSMNNLDKRIENTYESAKQVCKDIIFDFTKDEEYFKQKTKYGSVVVIQREEDIFNAIDKDFKILHNVLPGEYFVMNNSFI